MSARLAGYLSLLFALLSREVSRGAICDAVGRGTISVTALTCGHDTDRAHAPAIGAPSPLPSLHGDQRSSALDAEIRLITPERKQNATEATRQRHDRNAPAPPGG
jgi:hypothetical protein